MKYFCRQCSYEYFYAFWELLGNKYKEVIKDIETNRLLQLDEETTSRSDDITTIGGLFQWLKGRFSADTG